MVKQSNEPQITKLSGKRDEQFIQTNIPEIDGLIGGVPRGRITELWGQEGVGKTHLVTQLMVNLSKNHKILYVDAEFSLNKQRAADLGVVMDNVDYIADSRLERVTELLIASVDKYDLIILDSLAYLTPQAMDDNEVGENNIGLFARQIKHWVVKFRPRLGVSKTAFIAINQWRASLNMYVKVEPPGGKAWAHAVDVRLQLTSNSTDKIVTTGQQVGHWLHVKVVKSKVSQPFREVKYKVLYDGSVQTR